MAAVRYAGTLPTGGAVEFEVENGIITSVTPIKDSPSLPWIMPVLVDLQQNGAVGHSFSALKTPEELRAVTEALYRHGVGRVQATSGTEVYWQVLVRIVKAFGCHENVAEYLILGV